jgi:GH15 family glucan-1,4-alpha-glucosidase
VECAVQDNDEWRVVLMKGSVEAILRNQVSNGAIIASPDFAQYHFCWLRDASFSAYALDLVGEHDASLRYHSWVNRAVEGISEVIDRVIADREAGKPLDPIRMPPARFTLDGVAVVDDWPNFQIDGYGTWLWSLGQHLDLSGVHELPEVMRRSVERVAQYLAVFSLSPCYDVWEESGDAIHTSTLASVYGGLATAAKLLGDEYYVKAARTVQSFVLDSAAQHGYFAKSTLNCDVDASTLWLAAPFGLVESTDTCFARTVNLIEERLTLGGGIRRYSTDVYYGSGVWPVLTASLGWLFVVEGNREGAQRCLSWIERHFDHEGRLGEQFGGDVRDREHYDEWVHRWGPSAKDLTWSHAMYVVLCASLEKSRIAGDSSSFEVGGQR